MSGMQGVLVGALLPVVARDKLRGSIRTGDQSQKGSITPGTLVLCWGSCPKLVGMSLAWG